MDHEAAFLSAIRAAPGDATTRLVFADWLEERGDPRAAWVRDDAIWEWMAPDATHPVPRLLAAAPAIRLSTPPARRPDPALLARVGSVLARLGPAVVMEVRRWLRGHPDHWPCREVQDFVAAHPPTPLRAIDELRAELHKPSWYDQWEATLDLGFHGPAAAVALPDLYAGSDHDDLGLMQDELDPEDELVINAFFRTVGRIGPAAAGAAIDLAENLWYYSTAREAILLVRPDPELVLEHINDDNTADTELGVDLAAALAPDRVAFLTRAAQQQEGRKRWAAIFLLGEMGPRAAAALPALEALSRDESSWDADTIRQLVTEAVGKIRTQAPP